MNTIPYPLSPGNASAELTKVSPQYRSQVIKVLLSILLFLLGYLLVLIAAIAMMYYSLLAAGVIINSLRGWISLVAAGGVLITSGMFFFFIIKFLFNVKKDTDDSRIELQEAEHPLLFEFVRKVCEETKAPFPKKIVVSPHVNACVYYNSSFLSLFFPLRKNLEVGAGLINCINLTEFKAILAHEFGHFSQSSTRLGSYTYQFNRIVYNLLYENDNWLGALNVVTSIHFILAIFGSITVFLVKGVMFFFTALYKVMNLNYLALSREMEFHADSVAVSVSGSEPIISALYRLELGQEAYSYTVNALMEYQPEKRVLAENFFSLQKRNLELLAKEHQLNFDHGLPLINTSVIEQITVDNRLHYKDLWSSHPSTKEREQHASREYLKSETVYESPWILFQAPEKLQQQLSLKIPELLLAEQSQETVANQLLVDYMEKEEREGKEDPVYLGYYNYAGNYMIPPALADEAYSETISKEDLSTLFNPEKITSLKRHFKDMQDLEVLKQISEKNFKVKRFEFDGKSYTQASSATNIYEQLKKETTLQTDNIAVHNTKISTWFYLQMLSSDPGLSTSYMDLLSFNKTFHEDMAFVIELFKELMTFYEEHLIRYTQEEDLPYQVKKINELYAKFESHKKDTTEPEIPKLLVDNALFASGYKATFYANVLRNPATAENLAGFNFLYEDLNKLLTDLNILQKKLHRQVIAMQRLVLPDVSLS